MPHNDLHRKKETRALNTNGVLEAKSKYTTK